MEGIETDSRPCVGMGGNNIDMSEVEPMVTDNKKIKNRKKKRGQNKKLGIKFQIKKQEPVSLSINRKWDRVKKPVEKRKEIEEPGTEESDAMQNRTNHQEKSTKKPKKGKRRNNRDFTFTSPKVGKPILSVITLLVLNILIVMCGRTHAERW